jgi:hypothetical protein
MLHNVNENAPFWIKNGISVYEARWKSYSQMKAAMIQIQNDINLFKVHSLSTNLDLFEKQKGFEISQSVIEYIVETFGNDKLRVFLRDPENIFGIFKCTHTEFWQNWINFVHKKYIES